MDCSKLTKLFLSSPIDLTTINTDLLTTYTQLLQTCQNLDKSFLEFLIKSSIESTALTSTSINGNWTILKKSEKVSDSNSVCSTSSGYSSLNHIPSRLETSTPSGQKRPRKLHYSPKRKKSKVEPKPIVSSSDEEIIWASYENPNIAIGPDGQPMENFPVRLINDVDDEQDPLKSEVFRFQYINDSHCHMRRKDAEMIRETIKRYYESKLKKNELQPCNCDDDAKCIRNCECKTYYKLQKVANGECKKVLKRNKIHDPDKLIQECTQSCDCPSSCINQVVGSCCGKMNVQVSVKKTKNGMGYGLFADTDIEEGEFIGCYIGEMVIHDPSAKEKEEVDDAYYFEYWPEINQYIPGWQQVGRQLSLYVDARKYGNATRFVNHSCQPNLEGFHVIINFDTHNPAESQLPTIAFFAKRFIPKNEQLFTDYTSSYWEVMNSNGTFCKCETKFCKYSRKKSRKGTKNKIIIK